MSEKTNDFSSMTPEELLGSFQSILNIIPAFLAGVAAISLLVGGIGIANTMYTSVIERTNEIGVMKAIGILPKAIKKIYLSKYVSMALVATFVGEMSSIDQPLSSLFSCYFP